LLLSELSPCSSGLDRQHDQFQNRFMNAFTTATVFAAAFGLLVYFRYVMLTDWGFAVMKQAA
jgi:hypothetical protein